jgi:hypothetical protein
MATWTSSECQTQINLLKQDLISLRGQAERERFQEGNTQYETQGAIKSILEQIKYFENELKIALVSEGKSVNNLGYIERYEFGV